MEKTKQECRELSIEILTEFEELLDYHQIDIPDDDRESGAFEARLYGITYYNLEDKITDILIKNLNLKWRYKMNKYEYGDLLLAVGVDGVKFCKTGDVLVFVRNSKNYDTDRGLMVTTKEGTLCCIREDRVALLGDAKAIKEAEINSPKLHIVMQDSCNNYVGQATSIEKAVKMASDQVSSKEPLTIYELKAVKKIARNVIVE